MTAVTAVVAVADFFVMRELPRALAFIVHNVLASLVGVCFVAAALAAQRKNTGWEYQSLFLLCVGLGMLAIHIVKIFLSRC